MSFFEPETSKIGEMDRQGAILPTLKKSSIHWKSLTEGNPHFRDVLQQTKAGLPYRGRPTKDSVKREGPKERDARSLGERKIKDLVLNYSYSSMMHLNNNIRIAMLASLLNKSGIKYKTSCPCRAIFVPSVGISGVM